jgi:hypothetical protein
LFCAFLIAGVGKTRARRLRRRYGRRLSAT